MVNGGHTEVGRMTLDRTRVGGSHGTQRQRTTRSVRDHLSCPRCTLSTAPWTAGSEGGSWGPPDMCPALLHCSGNPSKRYSV